MFAAMLLDQKAAVLEVCCRQGKGFRQTVQRAAAKQAAARQKAGAKVFHIGTWLHKLPIASNVSYAMIGPFAAKVEFYRLPL